MPPRPRLFAAACVVALAGGSRPLGERQRELLLRDAETARQVVLDARDGTAYLEPGPKPDGEVQWVAQAYVADDDDDGVAVLAAGCFWGVELAFARLPGVLRTEVGYAGGFEPKPTYATVSKGETGHAEAVRITFDPGILTFEELLGVFFDIHDPTMLNRQGNDVGSQYRSTIFYRNRKQKLDAFEAIKEETERLDDFVVTSIEPLDGNSAFVPAEERHQRYLARKGQSEAKGETAPIRCYG